MRLIFFALLLMGSGITHAIAQEKRALLIGIGKYPDESGWKSLNALNDIEYLKNILPLRGFKPENISTLLNEKATKAGIEQAAAKLIASAGPGDIIMFHFSGHGQQITDDSTDEADGYDEAWVPYDAQARYAPTPRPTAPPYRGENHLRDDQVGKWLDSLSRKVGSTGSILVCIDACHSGTATRSQQLGVVRGDPTPFKIPGKKNERIVGSVALNENDFFGTDGNSRANVVTFSASSPTQVNFETFDANNKGVGSLTYAFSKALAELPPDATYSNVFFRVKAMIQAWIPIQFPMMEGNGSQLLFAGQYKAAENAVYIDRWSGDTAFTVKIGSLQQLSPGAELLLLDPQTQKEVATAVATKVSMVETMARVSTALDKTKLWEVRIKSVPVNPYKLQVGYDEKNIPKSWVPMLDKALSTYGFTEKSSNPDCWITFVKDTGLVVVTKYDDFAYNDTKVANGVLDQAAVDALKSPLQSIARVSFFRSVPDGGPLFDKISLQLIAKDGRKSTEHDLSFKERDLFDLVVNNKGSKPVYYSLVVIAPNGEMQVLLPAPGESPESRSLQPGTRLEIPDNEIEHSPEGREYFKVVLSENPGFDIRPLFTKMNKKRDKISSWEEAMIDIMQPAPGTVPKKRSVQVNDVTIITQSYLIKHQ
jgi:metacaspase-1